MEHKKIKFLIFGATGMAGHTISLYLYEQGYDVSTFSKRPFPYCKNIIGNVADECLMKSILSDGKYDVVINCIGILNQFCDKEPAKAIYLNSYFPHQITKLLRDSETKLIHMSTDCVFSGRTGSYGENCFCDGETFYDRTKALGEVCDEKNLTFRNSIIGPDMNKNGIGLFNWFMKQEESIMGYTRAIWSGVTTLILAKAMEQAAVEDLTGIYNLVNNDSISKYDLLGLFNKHFKDNTITIYPSDSLKTNKSLVNTRKDFSFKVPGYEQMILDMKEWMYQHKQLYPHYFGKEGEKNT